MVLTLLPDESGIVRIFSVVFCFCFYFFCLFFAPTNNRNMNPDFQCRNFGSCQVFWFLEVSSLDFRFVWLQGKLASGILGNLTFNISSLVGLSWKFPFSRMSFWLLSYSLLLLSWLNFEAFESGSIFSRVYRRGFYYRLEDSKVLILIFYLGFCLYQEELGRIFGRFGIPSMIGFIFVMMSGWSLVLGFGFGSCF